MFIGLINLKKLQDLVNLQELFLSSNKITSILNNTFQCLVNLQELELDLYFYKRKSNEKFSVIGSL